MLASILREWDWPRRPGLSEEAGELINYLERQAHRMEYPEYLAHGWCIGSGAVESAINTMGPGLLDGRRDPKPPSLTVRTARSGTRGPSSVPGSRAGCGAGRGPIRSGKRRGCGSPSRPPGATRPSPSRPGPPPPRRTPPSPVGPRVPPGRRGSRPGRTCALTSRDLVPS